MRFDIMMTWAQDKGPGPQLFQELRDLGGYDVLRNGTIKTGGAVYFTAYATFDGTPKFAKALTEDLYKRYDLDIVEVTWNPPEFIWTIAGWALDHNFSIIVDAHQNLMEWVSNRWLRLEEVEGSA